MAISPYKICLYAFLVVFTCYDLVNAADSCEAGWVAFKEEKCFKVLENVFGSYDEAEKNCSKLAADITLVTVHSKDEQEFLTNLLFKTLKKSDNFWLGSKFGENSSYRWLDNSELTFTNWDPKGARNKANYCIQMQADEASVGQWIDEPCDRKNAVVCQKAQVWTLARLQKAYQESSIELKELKEFKEEANKKITALEKIHNTDQQNLVPIGYIYTQMPQQKSPTELWPTMTWSEVSSSYEGVFFRVAGGQAAAFGQVQTENSPRVTGFRTYLNGPNIQPSFAQQNNKDDIAFGTSSSYQENSLGYHYLTGIGINMTLGEVRPRNMAIRIWQRTK